MCRAENKHFERCYLMQAVGAARSGSYPAKGQDHPIQNAEANVDMLQ